MSRKFEHLSDVEVFITVVDKGSMTEGAVALSTTASVVSRAIARLEARLGAQLLRRTTRRLGLTEAGRSYVEQARAAFALIAGAERDIQGRGEGDEAVTGRVRISAPTTYGHYRLMGMLGRYRQRYPGVQLEVSISNRNVDLVADGYDVAIRLGALRDSGLVSRKLEDASLTLVAAPSYLERAGAPASLEQLAGHALLPFVMPSTGRLGSWLLRVEGKVVEWRPQGGARVLDDVLGCVSLAEAGAGICQSYGFVVQDRLRRGLLVEVLPELSGATRPFSMLYAPHRNQPPALRTLIDFITQEARAAA
ncbi:LysR family transcriptional regulator [Oxalobacteraceae bacterium A2-2]